MLNTISVEDLELIKKINEHPELKARFTSILAIAQSECAGCQTADQAEGKVVDNLRKLGSEVLQGWANTMHKRTEINIKEESPQYKLREKKIS